VRPWPNSDGEICCNRRKTVHEVDGQPDARLSDNHTSKVSRLAARKYCRARRGGRARVARRISTDASGSSTFSRACTRASRRSAT